MASSPPPPPLSSDKLDQLNVIDKDRLVNKRVARRGRGAWRRGEGLLACMREGRGGVTLCVAWAPQTSLSTPNSGLPLCVQNRHYTNITPDITPTLRRHMRWAGNLINKLSRHNHNIVYGPIGSERASGLALIRVMQSILTQADQFTV